MRGASLRRACARAYVRACAHRERRRALEPAYARECVHDSTPHFFVLDESNDIRRARVYYNVVVVALIIPIGARARARARDRATPTSN